MKSILIHCRILLDFLYELYYDAWIHEHQKRKPKFACVHAMKVSRGCSHITPLMFNHGTKLGCTVNFIPLSHFTTVKKTLVPSKQEDS